MKFPFFFRTLVAGAIAIFLVSLLGLGWVATHSSINLLTGGVNYFPQATVFLPKQTPAMVSLLTNPEKLYGLRQVTLPLKARRRDRQEWQQWSEDLFAKIGFNYRQDIKPWLGDEVTFAIASLDRDRNFGNGVQPGYILATANTSSNLAQKCLRDFYSDRENSSLEQYKGANIISPDRQSSLWSTVVVGDFVLFANHPQILKEAINQAQAVSLNLQQSTDYQTAIARIQQPHLGIGYFDVLGLSAWLDKSTVATYGNNKQTLSLSLSVKNSDLAAQTILIKPDNSSVAPSFLNNPQLQQIFNSLNFDDSNSAYIDLQSGRSLLEDRIPLYKVSKLAIRSLFPHLKAIVIQNLERDNYLSRASILFKLDSRA